MPDKNIYWSKTGLIGGAAPDLDSIDGTGLQDGEVAHVFVSGVLYYYRLDVDSAETESSPFVIAPDSNAGDKRWILQQMYYAEPARNLRPTVNAAVNKLDIFAKSSGAAPAGSHAVVVAIPDANGYTFRSRAAAYLSGTSQIVMADAANYWSKGSLDAEIKTAWLYAIWDGTGIVWALAGYSGFTAVPTTTTATDDDYFLLEDGSTYTRDAGHYCVAVAKIRYQYDTADAPDHTLQATGENAPQVIWNPKSDYGYQKDLAASVVSGSDITAASQVSVVVKQAGKYRISCQVQGVSGAGATYGYLTGAIKTGNATYGSATQRAIVATSAVSVQTQYTGGTIQAECYLNTGDTIHLGIGMAADAGNRTIMGGASNATNLIFRRVD